MDRELDPGEFRCIICGRISGPHDRDGLGECIGCIEAMDPEEWEVLG